MQITILVVFIAVIVCIFISIFLKNKTLTKDETANKQTSLSINNNVDTLPDIQIIENSTIVPLEKNKITDLDIKKAIAEIDNYYPRINNVKNNIESASKLLNKNKAFFSANKKGTENMLEVKGTIDKYYGIQMKGNKLNKRKSFHQQTEFTKESKLMKNIGKKQLTNAVMGVNAMIVGQYYMNEINNKLETISDEIKSVADFLDSEYLGKIKQIVFKLQEIIDNKNEILSKDSLKSEKYNEIKYLETRCTTLLGQANIEIEKKMADNNTDYKKYENKIKEINTWFMRQEILQILLLKIGDLKYALSCDNATWELCHYQYNKFVPQINDINEKLSNWHKSNCEKFGVHKDELRKDGMFFEIRKNTIGRINEDWAYDKLNSEIVDMIDRQINSEKLHQCTAKEQNKIIKIQKYDGEYYNLLDNK